MYHVSSSKYLILFNAQEDVRQYGDMRVRDLIASIPVARRSFSNIVCSTESSAAPLGSSLTSSGEGTLSLRYESLGRLLNALPMLFSPILIIRLLTHKLFGGMVRKNTTSSSIQIPLSSSRHSTIAEHPLEHSFSLSAQTCAMAAKQAAAVAKQNRKKSRSESRKKRSESAAASKRDSKSAEKSAIEFSEYMSFIQDVSTREHSTIHLEYSKAEELGYNVVAPFSTHEASTVETSPGTPNGTPLTECAPSPEPRTELDFLPLPDGASISASGKHSRDAKQPAEEQKQKKSALLQWVKGTKSSVASSSQSKSHSREAKSSVGPVSSKSQISISCASDVRPTVSEAPAQSNPQVSTRSHPQKPTSLLSVERHGKPRSKSTFAASSSNDNVKGSNFPSVITERKQEMISAFQREIQNLPTFEMISSVEPVETISPSPLQLSPSNSLRNLTQQKSATGSESQCVPLIPITSTSTGSPHPTKAQVAAGETDSSSTVHSLHPACTPSSVQSPCSRVMPYGSIANPSTSLYTPSLMSPISNAASTKPVLQRSMSPTLEAYLRTRNCFRKMSLDDNTSASTIRRAVLSRCIAGESSPAAGNGNDSAAAATPEAPVAPKLPNAALRRASQQMFHEPPRYSITPTRLGSSPQHRLFGVMVPSHAGSAHPMPYALERKRNSISTTNCSHYLHSYMQSQREQLNSSVVATSAALAVTRAHIPTSNTNVTIMSITSSAASRSNGRGSQSQNSVESTFELSHSAVMRLLDFWSETCISDLISISNELKEFLRLFATFGTEYRNWCQQLWCRIKQDVRKFLFHRLDYFCTFS